MSDTVRPKTTVTMDIGEFVPWVQASSSVNRDKTRNVFVFYVLTVLTGPIRKVADFLTHKMYS